MKINERKPRLNASLKASNEWQLFSGVSKHHVLILCD